MKTNFLSPDNSWIEILKPGSFVAMNGQKVEFSKNDLEDLVLGVKNQIANGYEPPMVLGHPKDTSVPRVASFVDAKINERGFVALKADKVAPDFYSAVADGKYRYGSVSLNFGDYKSGIRHFGALGGVAPAVKGLAPIQFSESAEGKKTIELSVPLFGNLEWTIQDIGHIFRRLREWLIEDKGLDVADRIVSDWSLNEIENFETPEEEEAVLHDEAVKEAELAEKNAKILELAEKIKLAKEEENRKFELAQSEQKEFLSLCESAQKEGRLSEGQKGALQKIFNSAGLEATRDFVATMPKIVELGEALPNSAPHTELNAKEAAVKIADFVENAKRNGKEVSFAEAAIAISQGFSQRR